MFANYSNPMVVVDSADFDGTNDYMTRGAALTNIADSKTGTISLWTRIDGGDGTTRRIFSSTNAACQLNLTTGDLVQIICQNSSATSILIATSSIGYTAGATWLHLLMSWNLAVAGSGRFYINDASAGTFSTYTDDTIDYDGATDWSVGAATAGTTKFDGCLAEIYFMPGTYIDFSLVSNRRKFISASGKPVSLGSTGALPTGTAAMCYFHLDDGEAVANFATNRGTGGDYSITGTLATGSTSPSD